MFAAQETGVGGVGIRMAEASGRLNRDRVTPWNLNSHPFLKKGEPLKA